MFTLYRLLISEADPDAGQCGNRRWSESEFNARGNIKVRFLAWTFLLSSGSKRFLHGSADLRRTRYQFMAKEYVLNSGKLSGTSFYGL